ncbi:MAG TPA: sigma-54-dependent Fis family transcriptional regulator, partial [Sediminispirochaeta sp.]|nr:sigma-54-dependent Fis family transcriptional regulator [Sediminispirochaeta sp.]
VWHRIEQSSASEAKVLITGENGTGKELVAREIHRRGSRSERPFVELNCAAIPDTLLESELFGHEKGAFTSAVGRRKGKFELADGGTLFLDEIADMSLSAQAKVLRAVQEQRFERIGGEESLSVDVRLIAATNKNIPELISQGKFREDLFFRLNVVPIHVAPLRDRQDDLEKLITYFMRKYRKRPDDAPRPFTPEALDRLRRYRWPGNIRELKNFIERINIMTDEQEITAEMVDHFLGEKKQNQTPTDMQRYQGMRLAQAKADFERRLIEERLRECDFNISQTAESLGVYPSNLHGKIKKYGIMKEK